MEQEGPVELLDVTSVTLLETEELAHSGARAFSAPAHDVVGSLGEARDGPGVPMFKVTVTAPGELLTNVPGAMCGHWLGGPLASNSYVESMCRGISSKSASTGGVASENRCQAVLKTAVTKISTLVRINALLQNKVGFFQGQGELSTDERKTRIALEKEVADLRANALQVQSNYSAVPVSEQDALEKEVFALKAKAIKTSSKQDQAQLQNALERQVAQIKAVQLDTQSRYVQAQIEKTAMEKELAELREASNATRWKITTPCKNHGIFESKTFHDKPVAGNVNGFHVSKKGGGSGFFAQGSGHRGTGFHTSKTQHGSGVFADGGGNRGSGFHTGDSGHGITTEKHTNRTHGISSPKAFNSSSTPGKHGIATEKNSSQAHGFGKKIFQAGKGGTASPSLGDARIEALPALASEEGFIASSSLPQ